MKIIVFSDTHIHPYARHTKLNEDGRNIRLLEGVAALDTIQAYITSHGSIGAAFFCGDLFQHRESLPTEAAVRVRRALTGWGCPLVGLPGNHDKLDSEHNTLDVVWPWSGHSPVWDYYRHSEDTGPISYTGIAELQVDCVGSQPTQEATLFAINAFAAKPRNSGARWRILLLHESIDGSLQGSQRNPARVSSKLTLDNLPLDVYDYIFAGHVHIAQTLNADGHGAKVIIPGSLTQLNFGDVGGPRGFWVLDLERQHVDHVRVTTPRFELFKAAHASVPLTRGNGAHCRVVFPPGTNRAMARRLCDSIIARGAVTAEPDILPEEVVVPVGDQSTDRVNLQAVMAEYISAAHSDKGMLDVLRELGHNILGEAQDAEAD